MKSKGMKNTMCWLLAAVLIVSGAGANELIIFGDSLTDTGPRDVGGGFMKWLDETLRLNIEFPSYPYATGRYSNGKVWPEYVEEYLGIDFVNFAAGGATTGSGISQAGAIPGALVGMPEDLRVLSPNLQQELDQYYLSTNNTANPEDVYVVFMGNNDYFSLFNDHKNVTADSVVNFISDAVENLYNHGARKFIVVTIPPVAALPAVFLEDEEFANEWARHNDLLLQEFSNFNQTHSGATLWIFDFGSLVLNVALDASTHGFTNLTGPCLVTRSVSNAIANNVQPCDNPDEHLFWDTEHPTTHSHSIVGAAFAQQFAGSFGKVFEGVSTAQSPSVSSSPQALPTLLTSRGN